MKKNQKKTKRKPRLILARDSVRKLAAPDLSGIVGGAGTANCVTVTFPKCCLTI
jgi:hypothetical protein